MPIGIIPYELQSALDSSVLRDSDKLLRDSLGEIFSNRNLGLNVRSFSSDDTLVEFDAVALVDGTSAFTLTLPFANTWSSIDVNKSPVITVVHTTGSNGVIVAAQSGDTVNGASSVTVAAGKVATFITDGNTSWYQVGKSLSLTHEIFTSSGTFTWPDGVDTCEVLLQAPGGGGSSGASSAVAARQGGGGGAGEALEWVTVDRDGAVSETVTINAPGNGGNAVATGVNGNPGTDGGNVSFRNFTAIGGLGATPGPVAAAGNGAGANGSSQAFGSGGAGGAAGTASTLSGIQKGKHFGGNGGAGGGAAATSIASISGIPAGAAGATRGGCGGSSFLGSGGDGGTSAAVPGQTPATGSGYGAGGGGGSGTIAGGGSAGGSGGPGIVIVRYYA